MALIPDQKYRGLSYDIHSEGEDSSEIFYPVINDEKGKIIKRVFTDFYTLHDAEIAAQVVIDEIIKGKITSYKWHVNELKKELESRSKILESLRDQVFEGRLENEFEDFLNYSDKLWHDVKDLYDNLSEFQELTKEKE